MTTNKANLQLKTLLFILLLASLACSFVTEAIPELGVPTEITSEPAPNTTDPVSNEATAIPSESTVSSGLDITEITFFQDDFENWVVSGLLVNNTERSIDSIEIEIRGLNATGDSLYSEVVSASIYAIDSGEITPFDTTIWEDLPDLDHFNAAIVGQSFAEVERAQLEMRGVALTLSDDGRHAHISGEIINNGSQPVQINSLAAAIFNTSGKLISTNLSISLVRYLYPGESGPFRVSVTTPATRRGEISKYLLYTDARLTSNEEDHEITFIEEHNFTDGEGKIHLVGEVRNDSERSLNISLVAGIYDEANNVLDADTLSLALYALAPGESLSYDFDGWQPINDTQALLDQIDSYSVQWDPYRTWDSITDYITITTNDDAYEYDDFFKEIIFTGQIVNNTEQDIDGAVVVIDLRDKETGQLMATGNGYSFDPIPAGGSVEYKVYMAIESGLEGDLSYDPATNKYEFQTMDVSILAKGELP